MVMLSQYPTIQSCFPQLSSPPDIIYEEQRTKWGGCVPLDSDGNHRNLPYNQILPEYVVNLLYGSTLSNPY